MSRNWIIAGAAAVCFAIGLALSHRIEPGVRVQKVTLAEETPALKFIPAGAGPHSVALLAHGYAGSKESLFRYAEALAAAGFVCYDVDLPGHGASPRTYITWKSCIRRRRSHARLGRWKFSWATRLPVLEEARRCGKAG